MDRLLAMNVSARATRGEKLIRRSRNRGPVSGTARDTRPVATPEAAAPAPTQYRRTRREQTPTQDNALYTCHCGYVFEAAVSTSVGCPHCGERQAW
jgi:hypothetical protein